MKVRIDHDWAELVGWAARVLPSRATTQLQVLAGLLLDATGGVLKVAAFDYEVAAQGEIAAVVAEEGRALVNGKLLAEISRALPIAPVDLHVDGTRLVVTCEKSRFALPTMPLDDYPTLPTMPATSGLIGGADFAAAVAQVAPAAGRDDTLPVLTGVRLEVDGDTLTFAATDRYRLAVRTLKWRPGAGDLPADALIPAGTLADVAKASSKATELTIAVGTGRSGEALAGFAAGGRLTTTRLLEGKFPPYRKLLPDTLPLTAELTIAPLADAIRRVALVAARTAPVQLTFTPDHLVLEAGRGDEAQASETLPVTYAGPELTVAFNPSYLLDGLAGIDDDTAVIGFADAADASVAAGRPAVLSAKTGTGEIPDFRYLIMPIRLNG